MSQIKRFAFPDRFLTWFKRRFYTVDREKPAGLTHVTPITAG
jgi:hypothetical protein